MVDWVDLDGNVIPSATAVDPNAVQAGTGSTPTSLISTADASNDVDQTGVRGGWSGHSAGVQTPTRFRTYIRFPLALYPGITILNVILAIQCDWVYGNSADRYVIGPYNGDGLGDPASDPGLDAFARCDASADFYVYGDAVLTATGALQWELGAKAVADLTAAIAASATYFSVCIKQINESVGVSHYTTVDAFNSAWPPTLTISEFAPVASPTIFGVGSGTLNDTDTGVAVTGTDFGATKSNGWFELNSAANGSGTSVVQTIQSWNNTGIVFDVVKGGLAYGTVYAIVHDNNGKKSSGFAVTLQSATPPPPPPPPDPVVTGVSDTTLVNGETGVVVTGTDFGAVKGIGYIELNTSADGSGASQNQTDTAWGDTSATVTVVRGTLPYGTAYLIVHDDNGNQSNGFAVSLNEIPSADGHLYTTVVRSNPATTVRQKR